MIQQLKARWSLSWRHQCLIMLVKCYQADSTRYLKILPISKWLLAQLILSIDILSKKSSQKTVRRIRSLQLSQSLIGQPRSWIRSTQELRLAPNSEVQIGLSATKLVSDHYETLSSTEPQCQTSSLKQTSTWEMTFQSQEHRAETPTNKCLCQRDPGLSR